MKSRLKAPLRPLWNCRQIPGPRAGERARGTESFHGSPTECTDQVRSQACPFLTFLTQNGSRNDEISPVLRIPPSIPPPPPEVVRSTNMQAAFDLITNPERQSCRCFTIPVPGLSAGTDAHLRAASAPVLRGGRGKTTEADHRRCIEICQHQFSVRPDPAAHRQLRAASGDEPVQELWRPHGGLGG